MYFPSLAGPPQGDTITLGVGNFPTLNQARTYSFAASVFDTTVATITGGMQKFVDPLPNIPVATPDKTTYPGSDYYIIELVEYEQQLHSDLPTTKLRGYRQAGGQASYLGPAIIVQKDMPVRILFRNLLPTDAGGQPVHPQSISTVMGSGPTPKGHMLAMTETFPFDDPQNPPCSGPGKDALVAQGLCFSDNRAIVHLHGGISPWISDGTPHQWITPAGESTDYPQGTSVRPVPDMADDGNATDGEMTFYYTNQQSARLMFYHDHAWGITRLNVYAGMAAPYIIQDATEQTLVDGGLIPGPNETIPLVIQDKTFVPNDAQLAVQDETWDTTRWGGEGSLWAPHVYSPAQNPGDASGVNEFGRWAYGPWFWPPTNSIEYGPIPQPLL